MERPPTKPVAWLGSSLFDLRRAPADVQDIAGAQLALVEHGEMPRDWKPMPSVGTGVFEIRIQARTAHRILLTVKFHEAIYILHVFENRSRKTPRKDLEIARARLGGLIRSRSR